MARKKRGLFRRLKRIKQKQIEVMQSPEKAAKYKSFGIKSIICSLAAVICSAGLPFVSVRLLYLTMTADFLIVGNIFCAIASLICLFSPFALWLSPLHIALPKDEQINFKLAKPL